MRKKIGIVLFTLCTILGFTLKVNAANKCSSTTLYEEKTKVSEVNVDYEVVEETKTDPGGDPEQWKESYLLIKILNVPDDISINVESLNDTFNTMNLSYTDKDENSVINLKDEQAYAIKRYKFTIKSVSSECGGETLKTLTLNTPMINTYADSASCVKYPDFKYCRPFVDFDVSTLSVKDFNESFDKYVEELENKDKEDKDSATEVLKKTVTKYWVVIVVLIVLVGGLVTYIVIKKKRSKII